MSSNITNGNSVHNDLDTTPAAVEDFLGHVLDLVKKHKLVSGRQEPGKDKVVDFVHPAELEKLMGLDLGKAPAKRAELEAVCERAVKYSVHTTHPHFYNQLYAGVDGYGLAGAWLTEALNTNGHTFEVAPVFIVAERAVMKWMASKFGFDPETSDGIFAPGGSVSNMYGMVLARHRKFPDIKTKGLRAATNVTGDLVALTSDESHYSISKGANWLGLGQENVIKVKTDFRGRMTAAALEEAVIKAKSEGKCPFFVNATAGSTVMGAYDEFAKIAEVCKKHDLWFHVDACWGGAVVLSKKYRGLMEGCELADSVAWNLHKMICAPVQASAFITRHKGSLHEANCFGARYLFQQDKFYDVTYDTGDKSMQCGRKTESFKIWLMLKARGEDFLERIVDNCMERAEYLSRLVRTRPGFRPAFPDFGFDGGLNCANVCFEYVPEGMRGKQETEEWRKRLSEVQSEIKTAMILKGTMMIGYQPLPHKKKLNFFRLVIPASPPPTDEEMEYVVAEIDRCGKNL